MFEAFKGCCNDYLAWFKLEMKGDESDSSDSLL